MQIWLESVDDDASAHLRAAGWSLHNGGEVHRCPTHARQEPTEPGVYTDRDGQLFQAVPVPHGLAWRVLLAPRIGEMGIILHEPWNQLPLVLHRLIVDPDDRTEYIPTAQYLSLDSGTEMVFSGR